MDRIIIDGGEGRFIAGQQQMVGQSHQGEQFFDLVVALLTGEQVERTPVLHAEDHAMVGVGDHEGSMLHQRQKLL